MMFGSGRPPAETPENGFCPSSKLRAVENSIFSSSHDEYNNLIPLGSQISQHSMRMSFSLTAPLRRFPDDNDLRSSSGCRDGAGLKNFCMEGDMEEANLRHFMQCWGPGASYWAGSRAPQTDGGGGQKVDKHVTDG